ncbi:MAG: DUF1592 domain-containing protein, partial [Pirellulales bacterium]
MLLSKSLVTVLLLSCIQSVVVCLAQESPYDIRPPVHPPYFRIRYEASKEDAELVFPATFTIWIPEDTHKLQGIIVHQHGCGEGSCSSGLTGAFDFHWQALARKHKCALLSPTYEQPQKADCQMWCDPRNGSAKTFQRALKDLGQLTAHPELVNLPWALWGHSGGGHWVGGMAILHPERTVAVWLRSGIPLFVADNDRPSIKPHTLKPSILGVPMMCNLGTKEGVSVTDNRFKKVWPANQIFFNSIRSLGGLIGVAIDPLTGHECGNQRYLAIPWLDACLTARLPNKHGDDLLPMPIHRSWLGSLNGDTIVSQEDYMDDPLQMCWLPNKSLAIAWKQYVKDTQITDTTPPPAPVNLRLNNNTLTWDVHADLESGLQGFIIERDSERLVSLPEMPNNRFGRPIFQNLLYSDTPTQPLVRLQYTDTTAQPNSSHTYRIIAINTVGLESPPSKQAKTQQLLETPSRLPKGVRGFFAKHCFDCHSGDSSEGNLNLTRLSPAGMNQIDDRRWARIIERVEHGEMPPKDSAAPLSEERYTFLKQVSTWLCESINAHDLREGRVQGRQLSPRELERSLHALLGIDIPLANLIPIEGRPTAFTTNAERQTISHHRLKSHLTVVDNALDEAFRRAAMPTDNDCHTWNAKDIARKDPGRRCREPEMLHGMAVVWSAGISFYGRLPATTAPEDGWYRFHLTSRAINAPARGGVWSTVRSGYCVSSAPLLQFVTSFEATENPQIIEFEAWLPKGHMLEIRPGDVTLKKARFSGGQVGTGEGEPQHVPGVAIETLTMERIHCGPDDDAIRKQLCGNLHWEHEKKKGSLSPTPLHPLDKLTRLTKSFAQRAFRRPVDDAVIQPIILLAHSQWKQQQDFLSALRTAYRSILCSPRFFFFTESPGKLDDYEVATRLSYFLTGRPPDTKLLDLASRGQLNNPKAIHSTVDRLLQGTGLRLFVEDFSGEWLDLDQINFTQPDRKYFGQFDNVVKNSMVDETHTFLEELLRENRPISELVLSDRTYLNSRLAKYYGIDDFKGSTLQRVQLSPDSPRGGILTQGAILKVTANGSSTSPIIRGAWVAEKILGMEIPPPPSGVPAIEPDIRNASSIRQQVSKHRRDPVCASCHRRMDPLGFALENFDPAGQWRTHYRLRNTSSKQEPHPIDSADTLENGHAFTTLNEFKQIISNNQEQLTQGFAGQ